jgi:hypothetical protein
LYWPRAKWWKLEESVGVKAGLKHAVVKKSWKTIGRSQYLKLSCVASIERQRGKGGVATCSRGNRGGQTSARRQPKGGLQHYGTAENQAAKEKPAKYNESVMK